MRLKPIEKGMMPAPPGAFIRDEILPPLDLSLSKAAEAMKMRRAKLSEIVLQVTVPVVPLAPEARGGAVRGHWGIENRLHWTLDVIFKEHQSRPRKGHGAENMAVVRHFAINLVRRKRDKNSIKLRRKIAGWDVDYLASMLGVGTR